MCKKTEWCWPRILDSGWNYSGEIEIGFQLEYCSMLNCCGLLVKLLLETHWLAVCKHLASVIAAKTLRLLKIGFRGLPLLIVRWCIGLEFLNFGEIDIFKWILIFWMFHAWLNWCALRLRTAKNILVECLCAKSKLMTFWVLMNLIKNWTWFKWVLR